MSDTEEYRLFTAAYTAREPVTAKQERQATLAGLRAVAYAAGIEAPDRVLYAVYRAAHDAAEPVTSAQTQRAVLAGLRAVTRLEIGAASDSAVAAHTTIAAVHLTLAATEPSMPAAAQARFMGEALSLLSADPGTALLEHDRQTEITTIMRAAAVAAGTDAPNDIQMLDDRYAAGYERAKADIRAAILAAPNQEDL